ALDASHLLYLLEKQPSCLLRVGMDGTLLACNDAGLSLLGRDGLADVLNKPFQSNIVVDHHKGWADFTGRVVATGAGSFECDFAGSDGVPRHVLLQAIALRNHPDAIDSMLVAVRDVSPMRRLEATLRGEQQAQARVKEIERELEDASQERDHLIVRLEESRTEQRRLAAELKTHPADHER